MMTLDDRVAVTVFDLLSTKIDEGHAALLAQQVRTELQRDPHVAELFIVKVTDTAGDPHACVMQAVPAGRLPLFRLDIRGLRAAARQAMIEELSKEPKQ